MNLFFASITVLAQISFSEILPNPKGKDAGNEWIELINNTSTETNLENWQIKTNKTHTIHNKTIRPNSVLILDDLKIPIKNSNNTLQLLSPTGKLIDEVSYGTAPEGLSYSIITEKKEGKIFNSWKWTTQSRGKTNPTTTYYIGEAKVLLSSLPLPKNTNISLAKALLNSNPHIQISEKTIKALNKNKKSYSTTKQGIFFPSILLICSILTLFIYRRSRFFMVL